MYNHKMTNKKKQAKQPHTKTGGVYVYSLLKHMFKATFIFLDIFTIKSQTDKEP